MKSAPFYTEAMNGEIRVGFSTSYIEKGVGEAKKISLGISMGMLFIGVIMGYFIARGIAKPIKDLRDASQKVGEGDLSVVLKSSSTDEIGELVYSFNKMVQNMNQSQKAIETHNENLQAALDDLKQAQSHLVQSEKMAFLGQITAGVAHEINNPVNFISAGTQTLKQLIGELFILYNEYKGLKQYGGIPEDVLIKTQELEEELLAEEIEGDVQSILKDIQTGVERTSGIVHSLKVFSRLDESEYKQADIHENLESTLVILRTKLAGNVKITKQLDDNLPLISCYPGQLNQVFMNQINNSIDAMKSGGEIKIISSHTEKDVEIQIKDNGEGISQKHLSKIFDPFFTTKDVGKGTGLGLSISYGVIERHNGTIEVQSEEGKGTCFCITLPIDSGIG